MSTNGYVADANNDVDLDNNGSGNPFTDIFSGIVTLTVDGEPLNDGDPDGSLFDLDPAGNNTVDFGFYNPNTDDIDGDGFSSSEDCDDFNPNINPDQIEKPYNGIDEDCDGMDIVTSIHKILQSTIHIYPNPTIDIINIEVKGPLNFQANLYNLEGKLIITESNLEYV